MPQCGGKQGHSCPRFGIVHPGSPQDEVPILSPRVGRRPYRQQGGREHCRDVRRNVVGDEFAVAPVTIARSRPAAPPANWRLGRCSTSRATSRIPSAASRMPPSSLPSCSTSSAGHDALPAPMARRPAHGSNIPRGRLRPRPGRTHRPCPGGFQGKVPRACEAATSVTH